MQVHFISCEVKLYGNNYAQKFIGLAVWKTTHPEWQKTQTTNVKKKRWSASQKPFFSPPYFMLIHNLISVKEHDDKTSGGRGAMSNFSKVENIMGTAYKCEGGGKGGGDTRNICRTISFYASPLNETIST